MTVTPPSRVRSWSKLALGLTAGLVLAFLHGAGTAAADSPSGLSTPLPAPPVLTASTAPRAGSRTPVNPTSVTGVRATTFALIAKQAPKPVPALRASSAGRPKTAVVAKRVASTSRARPAAGVTRRAAAVAGRAAARRAGRRAGPVRIDIGTVPLVVGFPVTLDGKTHATDSAGVAHFVAANNRSLAHRVVLNNALMTIRGVPVRVSGQRLYLGLRNPRITLDLSYRVSFNFANSNGGAIDSKQIKDITVKSVTGLVIILPAHEASWLQGSRVVPLPGGLVVKDLYWTVQDVQYAGSNVVNASQQRFLPARAQSVGVTLLFYRVRLQVRDALFGFSLGSAIDLAYPDRTHARVRLGKGGQLDLASLPRGNYAITAVGPGPSMSRPIAISRDQYVDLKFYSWLDLVVLGAAALLFTGGGLWWGVRRRRRVEGARRGFDTAGDEPGMFEIQRPSELEGGVSAASGR